MCQAMLSIIRLYFLNTLRQLGAQIHRTATTVRIVQDLLHRCICRGQDTRLLDADYETVFVSVLDYRTLCNPNQGAFQAT
jgi:hypothetical protein